MTGISPDDFYLDESAPDHRVTLQAEVMNSSRFIDMRYALYTGMGMRNTYNLGTFYRGVRSPVLLDPYGFGVSIEPTWGSPAVSILRHYLDANSWDNLQQILAEYPDDVVELSAYDCSVGVLGWNTLFWEVRGY